MDLKSIIEIAGIIIIAYLFIRFVAAPIIRLIFGIIIFLLILHLLQRLGLDLDKILGGWGINLNLNKLLSGFDWILNPIDYYINKGLSFFKNLWSK